MRVDFQQGIVTYPITGTLQSFLAKTGVYVSLQTANGQTDVTFAHGTVNYLLTEASDVDNAWGPIPTNTNTWLFWDINPQTAVRTFGITLLAPLYGPTFPVSPTSGQHFFNTTDKKMYVWESGNWRLVLRVFAALVLNAVFTPLGSGFPSTPFAGTQVGLSGIPNSTGRIIVDDTAAPIRRVNGEFFTTETDFFVNGSPVNTIRLEANVLSGTSTALANMGAYQVVRYPAFGKINVATYNDLQTTIIAMLVEELTVGETGTVITQGTITNPAWNFSTVGAELWVDGNGVLTETDPHLSDPITYPTGKPAIGRVITPTMIFFDQGLGGKGDTGNPGPAATVDLATNSVAGVSKLSIAALDPSNPIVVGDNDPRMSDARTPLAHNQAATTVTFTPYGSLTAPNVQLVLQQVEDTKVGTAGDTMTGPLTLSGNPTAPLHAVPRQYIDNLTLDGLADVTLIVPSPGDFLYYTGAVWTSHTLILDDISDIDDSGANPGDVLTYNGVDWVPVSGGGSITLNNLTDVAISGGQGENAWLRWDQTAMEWQDTTGMPYDMHFFMPGKASGISGTVMGGIVLPRDVYITDQFAATQMWCEVPSTTAPVQFNVYVDGGLVAEVTFAIGSNTGTINEFIGSPYVISQSSRMTVVPDADNSEIEDVMLTFVGCTTKLVCEPVIP